jgi:hypothetical protein
VSSLRALRGTTISIAVAAKKADGTAQDLTGSTLRFMAKDRPNDLDAAAVISRDNAGIGGITIDNGPLGLATVTIEPASTAGFVRKRTLHWELRMAAGAVKKPLDHGRMTILPDVIRA